jgi:hypothetical protein
MHAQSLIVALLVLGSFAYASWTLMPAALRRRLAGALLGWPGLRGQAWLQRAARPAGGCGCDGCDSAPLKASADGAQPIRIVRRLPR